MWSVVRSLIFVVTVLLPAALQAAPRTASELAALVSPPFSIGNPVNDRGVHELLNSGGAQAGFVFETEPLAPIPGFSGAPINIFVMIDLEGRFLEVRLLDHNEPIFVSGLGEAPFRAFFEQYPGLAISQPMVVGTPYGDGAEGSSLTYLDGVTKATASVRIAHESLLAATRAVVQEKMRGVTSGPPAFPDPDHDEVLRWQDLVEQGIATRRSVTNAEIDAAFEGTVWANDDPAAAADPQGLYLDLWVVDLGPPSIARAALSEATFQRLQEFRAISTDDEPILLIDAGRHGLVSPDFVRNTAPDWLSAEQDGLPIALRDADLLVELAEDVPEGAALILRTDRRLGFDPTREWTLKVEAVREHGMFRPEIGTVTLKAVHSTPERFFTRAAGPRVASPWRDAVRERQRDLIALGLGLVALLAALGPGMNRLAGHPHFTPIRLGVLAAMLCFVGWWGQGQLSIVTVLGTLRAVLDAGSLAFLLYDPFSLLVWTAALLGAVLWGRGLFCGWLCPFGALQEFAAWLGRLLKLPQIELSGTWDRRMKGLKYVVLAGLVGVALFAPGRIDTAAEIEPFKTAITVHFLREWYYLAYAAFWLLLGMVLFKGFCRYVCPLGAFFAIAGLLRGRDWIARRPECGSPCQLCRVRCDYGAIRKSGAIDYSECFQCLECVTIHDDPKTCVPLVLAGRRAAGSRGKLGLEVPAE